MSHDPRVSAANRRVHLVGTLACCAMLAGSAVVFLLPGFKSRQQAGVQLTRLTAVAEELDAAARANHSLKAQVDKARESVESRMVRLVPAEDLNRRLAELTTLCLDHGLTPEVLQPLDRRSGGVSPILPIRFEVSGPLDGVYRLMGSFDDHHPDLHLESIAIEHTGPRTVRMRTVLLWLAAPSK
jgi:Tfp pilus assembly protein PilO